MKNKHIIYILYFYNLYDTILYDLIVRVYFVLKIHKLQYIYNLRHKRFRIRLKPLKIVYKYKI